MHTTRMTIGEHDYLLDPATDVPALQVEICDAMRRGSGIVGFDVFRERRLTVVISPGVPVLFEAVDSSPVAHSGYDTDELVASAPYLDGY